jgi:hypothetical protein
VVLVTHRQDLSLLSLIDPDTNELLLKVNDRVSHIESSQIPGRVTHRFGDTGLYIVAVQPGSFGFGPDGFDLYMLYLEERQKAVV